MAYKDYRINVNVNSGEKVLKVNLKQGIESFKILSLTINTEDTYQYPSSDYGVIVGRVLANDAFGVPNVKVSVFVSLSSEDEDDDLMSQIYPYKTVNSRDENNIEYNLIQTKPYAGIDGLHTTTGTFPSKRLVLDNDTVSKAYGKYWEYSTVTNESGDYMIFGVPTGTCQVHFDCDLSDVGLISQRPYDFINKGYSADLFKSATEFKDDNVNNAVNILSQDTTVFVYPFWGDKTQNQIGITRNDLNLDYKFEPCCIFMGSSITDPDGTYFSTYGQPVGSNGRFKTLATSAGNIEVIRKNEDGLIEQLTENVKGIIDGNGVWCYSIPMNLDRIGTDEEGNTIPIMKPNAGIPTRARMRMRITLTSTEDTTNGVATAKMLIPNNPPIKKDTETGHTKTLNEPIVDYSKISQDDLDNYYEFGSKTPDICFRDFYWGKVYSIKQYIPRIQYDRPYHRVENTSYNTDNGYQGFVDYSSYPMNFAYPFSCICSIDSIQGFNPFPYTTMYAGAENWSDADTYAWFFNKLSEFSSNNGYSEKGLHFCFENDWINGCLYFPKCQIVKNDLSTSTYNYFGSLSSYENSVYTGRHNCHINGSELTTRQYYTNPEWYKVGDGLSAGQANDQDNTSIYSHVKITNGILEKSTNSLGQNIFYYRGGKEESGSIGGVWEMFYATDIITLGNLVDIYDSLPKLYENIPVTTATFPPLVPPQDCSETGMNKNGYTKQLKIMYYTDGGLDTENVDMFGNYTKFPDDSWEGEHKVITGQEYYDFDNDNQYWQQDSSSALLSASFNGKSREFLYIVLRRILERYSLFFGCRVRNNHDFLHYFVKTFVNTSRICELDVHNNQYKRTPIANLAINGIISRRDIFTDENRMAFASMNNGKVSYSINDKTKQKVFVPFLLRVVDFDGRLSKYCNYREYENCDEVADNSYIFYRYGYTDGPMRYHCTATEGLFVYDGISGGQGIENNEDLPLPLNSFYFYFGLRTGLSALDKFKEKYGISSKETTISKSNYLTIKVSDSENCGDGKTTHSVTVTINSNIQKPYDAVIKRGTVEYCSFSKYSLNMFVCGNLIDGNYVLTLTDGKSNKYIKRFTVVSDPIEIETDLDYKDGNYQLKITKIDSYEDESGLELSNYTYNEINGLRYKLANSWYFIWFDEYFTLLSDNKTISTSGTTLTGHISSFYKQYTNPCKTSQFFIKFGNPNASTFKMCGIPIDVIPQWNVGKTQSRAWDYKKTTSTSSYSLSGYSEEEQLYFVSQMINSVYHDEQKSISFTSELTKYTPNVVTTNITNFSHVIYNLSSGYTDYKLDCSGDYKAQKVVIDNPSASNTYDLPHIIGQNYPISASTLTLLKTAKGGGYENNKHYTIYDGSSTYLVNHDYFYFFQKDDANKDKPSEINEGIRSSEEIENVNWEDSKINGFSMQTVDKRFDYQFVVKTPSILPSGYDKFSNLSNKSISKGSIDMTIYGGVRIDKDANNKVTCYSMNGGILSGNTTSKASLYTQSITEDSSISLLGYVNDVHIWNQSYNDEVNIKESGALIGNTGLYLNLADCGDFSDGNVHGNKTLDLKISYSPGASIIQKETISSDDYDVLYEYDEYDSSYDVCGSFNGSTLQFKLNADENYAGSTYTDINTKSGNSIALSSQFIYPESSKRSLSVLVGTKNYDVDTILTSEASNYDGLNYDSNICYYPTYGTDNTPLNDSSAESCYIFQIQQNEDLFPEHATITIPTRKFYREQGVSLLKQGVVYNTGYAYYASKIHVEQSGETDIYVSLYTPLADTNKKIDFTTESLNGHTIGELNWSCAEAEQVTYDEELHMFHIKLKTGLTGEYISLYFMIKNGLKYKLHIPINTPNLKYNIEYKYSPITSGSVSVTANGSMIDSSGTTVGRGATVVITASPKIGNRIKTSTINGTAVEFTQDTTKPASNDYIYKLTLLENISINIEFEEIPEYYDLPGDVIITENT